MIIMKAAMAIENAVKEEGPSWNPSRSSETEFTEFEPEPGISATRLVS